MKAMTFQIPEELKARLDAHAEERKVGIAETIRKAIEQYLRRAAKP
jgi:predicted transcriptional regulator